MSSSIAITWSILIFNQLCNHKIENCNHSFHFQPDPDKTRRRVKKNEECAKSLKNSVKNKEKVSLVAWLDKKEKRREEKKQRAPVISRL